MIESTLVQYRMCTLTYHGHYQQQTMTETLNTNTGVIYNVLYSVYGPCTVYLDRAVRLLSTVILFTTTHYYFMFN